MVLSQISNKFHKFQQITKQGKEMYNVRQTGINADYNYPMFCKQNIQCFVNILCKVCISTCLSYGMVYCPTILNLCMTNFLIHGWPIWQEEQQNTSNSSYCIDFVVLHKNNWTLNWHELCHASVAESENFNR